MRSGGGVEQDVVEVEEVCYMTEGWSLIVFTFFLDALYLQKYL
jgi:hypothetical protein